MKEIVSILALVVSLFTARIAYLAYKKFVSRKGVEKQLEVMLEFIQSIQSSINRVRFDTGEEVLDYGRLTIFDFAKTTGIFPNTRIYFFKPFGEGGVLLWDFYKKYINHPLLPIPVAEKLACFKIDILDADMSNRIKPPYFFISNLAEGVKREWETSIIDIDTFHRFQLATHELKESIKEWFVKQGITELNL